MLYVIIVVLVSGLVALIVYLIDKRKRSDKEYTDYFMDKMMANMLYYKNLKEMTRYEIIISVGFVMNYECPDIMVSDEIKDNDKVWKTFEVIREKIYAYEKKHNREYTIFDIPEIWKTIEVTND